MVIYTFFSFSHFWSNLSLNIKHAKSSLLQDFICKYNLSTDHDSKEEGCVFRSSTVDTIRMKRRRLIDSNFVHVKSTTAKLIVELMSSEMIPIHAI